MMTRVMFTVVGLGHESFAIGQHSVNSVESMGIMFVACTCVCCDHIVALKIQG